MKVVGFDVGTGNIVSANRLDKTEEVEVKSLRNMFLPISKEDLSASEIAHTQLDYVEIESDGEELILIIAEDAFRFSNIFNAQVRRPMQKGVLSTQDIDAMEVMSVMIEKMIGKVNEGFVVYSVPAAAVDISIPPIVYHEKIFGKIFDSLGYKSKPMNEAMSIIFSECEKENFTGIGISFGAGLTNVCCAYKGTPTLTFSISKGGDSIDQSVAESTGKLITRVTAIKEKDLDLFDTSTGKKEERRIKQSLAIYYENLIRYVLKVFIAKFKENSEGLSIDEEIPIILSGGTSKPKNFDTMFKNLFKEQEDDFPYNISEIRRASDPLAAVALGNLKYAEWDVKRLEK